MNFESGFLVLIDFAFCFFFCLDAKETKNQGQAA